MADEWGQGTRKEGKQKNGLGKEHTHSTALSGTTQVSRYQRGKTNLDFTEARDSEWQWHQLGRMQVCTSLQTDNHASTPPLSFLQAGRPSCRPTNSVKALKAQALKERNGKGKKEVTHGGTHSADSARRRRTREADHLLYGQPQLQPVQRVADADLLLYLLV